MGCSRHLSHEISRDASSTQRGTLYVVFALDPVEPWGTLTAPGWAAPRCLGAVWPSWEVLRATTPRTGRVLGSPCPAPACGQGSRGHGLLVRGHLVSSWQAEHHGGPPVLRRPVSAAVHLPAIPAHHGPCRTPRAPDAQHQLDKITLWNRDVAPAVKGWPGRGVRSEGLHGPGRKAGCLPCPSPT